MNESNIDGRDASNYLRLFKTDVSTVATTDTMHILHHDLRVSLSASKFPIDDGMSGECFTGRK